MTAVEHAEHLLAERDLPAAAGAFHAAAAFGDVDRCAGGLWLTHMLLGDFAAAWRQSDYLRGRGAPDPHRFWNGEEIGGKRLMLRCLHGFGDAVQMLRYLPDLQQRCSSVAVEVPPRLLALAACFAGIGNVITWGEGAPAEPSAWDVQVEIMELPYLFRTTCAELPIATCYLTVPPEAQREVIPFMSGTRKRVGVVWSTGEWNRTRAIPFECVQALVKDNDIEFWNLQGGAEHDEWNALAGDNLRDGADAGEGILTLAALIEQMDLIVTADTLAAHVAGALGKPAWVVLQYAADWRWMHARSDSPWYPSLRLFRQTSAGDWGSAMVQVQTALSQWKVAA